MSLSEVLKPAQPVKMCRVAVIVEGLSGADKDALVKALGDPRISAEKIESACRTELGSPVSASLVRTHRRGGCACR